jgi:DNA topoisomerase-1
MTSIERLESTGLRRSSDAKGRWRDARSLPARPSDLKRIAALRIPPAWTDVRVSPSASSKLQAIGRDGAGRWQYIYHEAWVRRTDRRKYARLARFIQSLPKLRRAVALDLESKGLSQKRVLACMVRILMCHFIRPGSPAYERENGSYGLTTLRRRHVRLEGRTVVFEFKGKSGKEQRMVIRDRAAVRVLGELHSRKGNPFFRHETADGTLAAVRPAALNTYIHERLDGEFSAKDFRTWAGSLLCAGALARAAARGEPPTRRLVAEAVRETSEALHNTPAVTRSSYIAPRILETFEKGVTVEHAVESVDALASRPGLDATEKSLLGLLETPPKEP